MEYYYYKCIDKNIFKQFINKIPENELLKKVGVSKSTVWHWCDYKYVPNKKNVEKIIEIYKIKEPKEIGYEKVVLDKAFISEEYEMLADLCMKFTNQKIAKELGYTKSMISKWLNCKEPLTEQAKKKIREYNESIARVDLFRYSVDFQNDIPNIYNVENIGAVRFGKCVPPPKS